MNLDAELTRELRAQRESLRRHYDGLDYWSKRALRAERAAIQMKGEMLLQAHRSMGDRSVTLEDCIARARVTLYYYDEEDA